MSGVFAANVSPTHEAGPGVDRDVEVVPMSTRTLLNRNGAQREDGVEVAIWKTMNDAASSVAMIKYTRGAGARVIVS